MMGMHKERWKTETQRAQRHLRVNYTTFFYLPIHSYAAGFHFFTCLVLILISEITISYYNMF